MKTAQIKTLVFITLVSIVLSSCTKSSDIEYPKLNNVITEDFETSTGTSLPTGWTSYAEVGTKLWSTSIYGGSRYATVTAFGSGDAVDVSWLISPSVIIAPQINASLSFQTCHDKYVTTLSNTLELYISTDYNGNFGASHWTKINYTSTLPYPYTGSYVYVNSGAIDLSAYSGTTIHFAFRYTGINPSVGAYQVDNIKIVY